MFMVQSGLIRRSLVAFSTATVAEDDDDDEDAIGNIFSLPSLSLSKTLQLKTNENQKTKKNASLFTQRIKFKPSTTMKPVYSTPYFRGKFRRAIIVCLDGWKIPKP